MGRQRGLRGRLVLLLVVLALVGVLLPPFPPPAQAAGFIIAPTCTVPGGSVSFSGSGAPSRMYVTIHIPGAGMVWLQVPIGQTQADASGNFEGNFTLPVSQAAGSYTVEARWAQGMGSGILGTASLTVVADAKACGEAPPSGSEPPYPTITVWAVHMVSSTLGWATVDDYPNRKDLWTYDGKAWSRYPQEFPGSQSLTAVYMLSASEGWALGEDRINWYPDTIFYRYDGQSWSQRQSLPSPITGIEAIPWSGPHAIHMLSSSEGWAVRVNQIYRYDGKEWAAHTSFPKWPDPDKLPNSNEMLYEIFMVSPQEGWAVGEGRGFYRYKDGQWTVFQPQDPSLRSAPFRSIFMLSASEGWAVGRTRGDDVIARYDGQDWKVAASGRLCSGVLRSIFMLSNKAGIAVGDGCILRYDGETWQSVAPPAPYSLRPVDLSGFYFNSAFLLTPTYGWIVGNETWRPSPHTAPTGGFYRYTGASLALNRTSGVPGINLVARGSGFPPDSPVSLSWGGSLSLASVWPTASGAFTATVNVPGNTPEGRYKLVAAADQPDAEGNIRTAEASFLVTALPKDATTYAIDAPTSVWARLAGSYGSTPPGEIDGQYLLRVRVSRVYPLPWQPASGVGVTFNLLESPGSSLSTNSATTDSQGWASVTVYLGQTPGVTTVGVAAGTASETVIINAFQQPAPPSGLPPGYIPGPITGGLSEPPAIKLKPSSGPPGARVEVHGSGFQSSFVEVFLDKKTKLGGTYAFLGSLGGSLKVEIPAGTDPGYHYIYAINKAGDYDSASFYVGDVVDYLVSLLPTPTATPVATATPTPTPTATPVVKGIVRGTVYDRDLNKPVSPKYGTSADRASIRYQSSTGPELSVPADEEGQYILALTPGRYRVRASNGWYVDADWQDVEVQAGRAVTKDFYLTRKQGVVRGLAGCFDSKGNKQSLIAGLLIKLQDVFTGQVYETRSLSDGSYSFTVGYGIFKMAIDMERALLDMSQGAIQNIRTVSQTRALCPGKLAGGISQIADHNKAAAPIVVNNDTTLHDVMFAALEQVLQKAQVSGKVEDMVTANKLMNLTVNLLKAQEEGAKGCIASIKSSLEASRSLRAVATATTDKDGNYNFSDLDPGTYVVSISDPSLQFDPPTQCVTVGSSSVSGVDFNTAKPSFLVEACPVSGQERRSRASWLQDFLDYLRTILSHTDLSAYDNPVMGIGMASQEYRWVMEQVTQWNNDVAAAVSTDPTVRREPLLIEEAWAAQQKPEVPRRLLVDLAPYQKRITAYATLQLPVSASDQKAIAGIISGYYKQFPKGAPQCTSPRFQVKGHSPFTLAVIDEEGRLTGVDPATQAQVNQIPGASYTGPLTDTQVVEVPYPSGRYWVQATGTGSGQYGIEVVGLLGQRAVVSSTLTGTIQTGTTFLAAASVGAEGLDPTVQVSVPTTMTRKVYLPFLASSAQGW